jgi:general L-amino acid transport system substrate-binding protein
MSKQHLALALVGFFAAVSPVAAQSTLQTVKARGFLNCGSNAGVAGFGAPDSQGNWAGLDVDLCRAIAAAIFNDTKKVRFIPVTTKERFTALVSGEIDVLARNSTWTMSREAQLGVTFVGVNFYDGQGFMVRRSAKVGEVKQLDGATVCTQQGTTTELNLADHFRRNKLAYEVIAFGTSAEALEAYKNGRCDAYTDDTSTLYAQKLSLPEPDANVILPEVISKEPLGPAVRKGDNQWADLVRWVHFAMLTAEELGVTQANVDSLRSSDNPAVRRLLGVEGGFGEAIGVSKDWGYQIVKLVGNYGESFDRNLGAKSPLKIARGLNNLWTAGGLHLAPPIR